MLQDGAGTCGFTPYRNMGFVATEEFDLIQTHKSEQDGRARRASHDPVPIAVQRFGQLVTPDVVSMI
jgi:hypothetical protein